MAQRTFAADKILTPRQAVIVMHHLNICLKKKDGGDVVFKANIDSPIVEDRALKEREKRKYKDTVSSGRFHPSAD
jgi:hypothetical protein